VSETISEEGCCRFVSEFVNEVSVGTPVIPSADLPVCRVREWVSRCRVRESVRSEFVLEFVVGERVSL